MPGSLTFYGGNNQVADTNELLPERVSVQARDANNNILFNEPLVWSVPQSGPSGAFSSTGTNPYYSSTGPDGTALGYSDTITTNGIPGTWVGAVQMVNDLGVSAGFNVTNRNQPVATTIVARTNGRQQAPQNGAYLPVTLYVADQYNDPIAGVPIIATVLPFWGSWPGGLPQERTFYSQINGEVYVSVITATSNMGQFPVEVEMSGQLYDDIIVFTTVSANEPAGIVALSGSNQSTGVDTTFPLQLVAKVTNALNEPIEGASVVFTAPASGPSCVFPSTLSTATVVTDTNGWATSPFPTANSIAGAYTVTAQVNALIAYFGLNNGPAPVAPTQSVSLGMCEA